MGIGVLATAMVEGRGNRLAGLLILHTAAGRGGGWMWAGHQGRLERRESRARTSSTRWALTEIDNRSGAVQPQSTRSSHGGPWRAPRGRDPAARRLYRERGSS